jgi:hypothetical protein
MLNIAMNNGPKVFYISFYSESFNETFIMVAKINVKTIKKLIIIICKK